MLSLYSNNQTLVLLIMVMFVQLRSWLSTLTEQFCEHKSIWGEWDTRSFQVKHWAGLE